MNRQHFLLKFSDHPFKSFLEVKCAHPLVSAGGHGCSNTGIFRAFFFAPLGSPNKKNDALPWAHHRRTVKKRAK
jgi:hypothetical protein